MHGEINVSFECRDMDSFDAIYEAIKAITEVVANDVRIRQTFETE